MGLRKNPYRRGIQALRRNIHQEYRRVSSNPISTITITDKGYDFATELSADSKKGIVVPYAPDDGTSSIVDNFVKYIENIASTASIIEDIIIEDFGSNINAFIINFERDCVDVISATKDVITITTSDPTLFNSKKSCAYVCLQVINQYISVINEESKAKSTPTQQLAFDFEFHKVPLNELKASEIKARVKTQTFYTIRKSIFEWQTPDGLQNTDLYGEDVKSNRITLLSGEVYEVAYGWLKALVASQGCIDPISSYVSKVGTEYTEIALEINENLSASTFQEDAGTLIDRNQVSDLISSIYDIEMLTDKIAMIQILIDFWLQDANSLIEVGDGDNLISLNDSKATLLQVKDQFLEVANQLKEAFTRDFASKTQIFTSGISRVSETLEFTTILENLDAYFKRRIEEANQKIKSIRSRDAASLRKREGFEALKSEISDAYRTLLQEKREAKAVVDSLPLHIESLDSDPLVDINLCESVEDEEAEPLSEQLVNAIVEHAGGLEKLDEQMRDMRLDTFWELEEFLKNIISEDSFELLPNGTINYRVDTIDFEGIEIPKSIKPKGRLGFVEDLKAFEDLKESINVKQFKRLYRFLDDNVFNQPKVSQILDQGYISENWDEIYIQNLVDLEIAGPLFYDVTEIIIIPKVEELDPLPKTLEDPNIDRIFPRDVLEFDLEPTQSEDILEPTVVEELEPTVIEEVESKPKPKPKRTPSSKKPLGLTISFNQQGVKRTSKLKTNVPFMDFYKFVDKMQRNIASLFTFYLIDTTDVDFEVSLVDGISEVEIFEDAKNGKIDISLPSHFSFSDKSTIERVYLKLSNYLASLLTGVEFESDEDGHDDLDAFEIFQMFQI